MACFSGANLISIIVGSVFLVALLFLALLSSLIQSSVEPIVNDQRVLTGVLFKNQYYASIAFMTINKFWIAPAIGADGNWWEALFNLITLTLLMASVIYLLPYQVIFIFPESNCISQSNLPKK